MGNVLSSSGREKLYSQFKPKERFTLFLEAMARGDDSEADRLSSSCPRKTYDCPDAAFEDRRVMVLDIVMVACSDLRAITAQLRLLEAVIADVEHFSLLYHIGAQMAFVDGSRCARGQSQSPFFAAKQSGGEGEQSAKSQIDDINEKVAVEDDEKEDPPFDDRDYGQRMDAVSTRFERTGELILGVMMRTAADLAIDLVSIWAAFEQFCTTRLKLPAQQMLKAFGYPEREELLTTLSLHKAIKPNEATVTMYRDGLCSVWDRRFKE